MRLELVRIGNSWGIRIPKVLLKKCGFEEFVDVHVEQGRLIIGPSRPPRAGWSEAFQSVSNAPDDLLLLESATVNAYDHEEWTW